MTPSGAGTSLHPPMSTQSIQLNGKPHPLDTAVTVTALLTTLGLADKPVVIELNGDPLLREEYARTEVRPGATLEIITLAAGG